MEAEVHCVAGNILTKWWVEAHIGIFGFIREKINGAVKIKVN